MHSILQSHHQPTTVDHAVKCHFFNDFDINLVTASASVINVYKLYEDASKVKHFYVFFLYFVFLLQTLNDLWLQKHEKHHQQCYQKAKFLFRLKICCQSIIMSSSQIFLFLYHFYILFSTKLQNFNFLARRKIQWN